MECKKQNTPNDKTDGNSGCAEQENSGNTLICEACEPEGVKNAAAAFCVNCQDYLCTNCAEHHCLPRPTKLHKILRDLEMPKRKVSTSRSENCTKHGESIKFYCKSHNDIGCHTCIATVHRTCQNINTLEDMAKDIKQSKLYNETKGELKETEDLFKAQKLRIAEKDQLSRQCYKTALEELTKRRKEINQQFDKLEQEIKTQSTKVCRENAVNMKYLTDSCTKALDSIESIKSDIQLLDETDQKNQLFIALKKVQLEIGQMKSTLLKIKAVTKVKQLQLLPSAISSSLIVRQDSLGFLEDSSETQTNKGVNSKDIYEQIGIAMLIEMSATTNVATDYHRCQVLLYNKNFRIIQRAKFATGPWDITKTDKCVVAVTFPHEKIIKFLYISDGIQDLDQISTPGHCRGVTSVDNKLAVTFSNPPALKILNCIGESTDIPLTKMFSNLREPAYVAADENKNIFVTDPVVNTIVKLDIKGQVKSVCRSVSKPLHVCVFGGHIYVSDCKSSEVHVLSYDFVKLETVTDFNDILSVGEFAISPAGVAFQGIFKNAGDDVCQLGKYENVKYIRDGKDTVDKRVNSGNRCVIS